MRWYDAIEDNDGRYDAVEDTDTDKTEEQCILLSDTSGEITDEADDEHNKIVDKKSKKLKRKSSDSVKFSLYLLSPLNYQQMILLGQSLSWWRQRLFVPRYLVFSEQQCQLILFPLL